MNALTAGVMALLTIAVGVLLWRSLQQSRTLQALEKRIDVMHKHLEDEVRMASRGAFGVGKRLIEAERRLGDLHERFEQLENLQAAESQSRQARRILQKTVTEEEPTRNEAKLAALLKGETEENL